MTGHDVTCWTLIEGAASGDGAERDSFVRRYLPVLRAYLLARWRGQPSLTQEVEDACQEIILECIKERGALARVERDRPGGFRAYLYGIARNVARRWEQRRQRNREVSPDPDATEMAADEASLSVVFDREWARRLMREAAKQQARSARTKGKDAERRVELLALRFQEDLPVRDIAKRWGEDPAHIHREYARARKEFQQALQEVLAFYHPDEPAFAEQEGQFLMGLLG